MRQGTGLVRKDVLDLTEIVGEVPGSCKSGLVELLVPYLRVKVNERSLAGAHKLDRDVERDGDDVLECDEGKGPGDEPVDGRIVVGKVVIVEPQGAAGVVPMFKHGVYDGTCDSHEGKDN